MSQLSQALILVVQTLGSLYLLIVLLRFILQLVRADFYNPLSQFIVRATHPLLRPLRRIIPSVGGIDLASLVLALLVQIALMAAILMIAVGTIGNPLQLLLWALVGLTGLFLNIFFWALLISVILSWVAPGSHNPGALLIGQITEPVLAPFRKFLPSMGGLDLSPIFAFLAIKLLEMLVINNLAAMTQMPNLLRSLI
jgi:YggT family protein